MTVFEIFKKEFVSPVEPYEFQHQVLEDAFNSKKVLLKLKGGGGKTYCSIWLALAHSVANEVSQIICIVPAPLVSQWASVWETFNVKVTAYQGTPSERKKLDVKNCDILVLSKHIFQQEWMKKEFTGKTRIKRVKGEKKEIKLTRLVPGPLKLQLTNNHLVIYDEMQSGLRASSNSIWKYVKELTQDSYLIALSATPISNPEDCFGVVKILGSKAYKTRRHFELKHVAKRDYFNKIIAWDNLDYMKEALSKVSVEVPTDAYKELPKIVFDRVIYDLTKKHRRDYETLAEDKLLETEDVFLDATESENLWHVLQRYVTAPEGSINKTLLELLRNMYEEDDSPMIIFGNYQVTNRAILDYFGDLAVGKWGEFSRAQQGKNLELFLSGKKKILIGNPSSLGVGTDGLQDVCYRAAFAEVPVTSVLFEQCCWRIHRDGQTNPCVARVFTARGTLQMRLYQACLDKDALLQQVLKKEISLRNVFLG